MSDTRTAASLKERIDEMLRTVQTLMAAMKLRQWAVEQAREALRSTAFPSAHDAITAHMKLADELHAFVSRPALEAARAIEAVTAE